MPDLLQDLEAYFISQGLVAAGTMFLDDMPDSPSSAVCIYEYEGIPGLPQITGAVRSVQIVVRDISPLVAKGKIGGFYKSLMTEDGILKLTAERWCMPHLRQTPFKLKVDEQRRIYYAFNVGFTTYID